MIDIKSKSEIELLRQGGKILTEVMDRVAKAVKAGVTTDELNKLARELIFSYGARPSFEGYKEKSDSAPYPAALCASVNDEVVHMTPGDRILKEGDIIGLDLGVIYKNMFTDMAVTVGVGEIDNKAKKLIEATKESLYFAIAKVKPGSYTGDIGAAVSAHVESKGFSAVRQLVGHGVGRAIHEEPQIPNYGKPGTGEILRPGMVIAIEPMVNIGNYRVREADDGFGFKTVDGSLSAHFEHTVAVTEDGYEILTQI